MVDSFINHHHGLLEHLHSRADSSVDIIWSTFGIDQGLQAITSLLLREQGQEPTGLKFRNLEILNLNLVDTYT